MSLEVKIIKVEGKKLLRQFIYLPKKIYRGELYSAYHGGKIDPHWVPPMWMDEFELHNKEKHPFHKHANIELFLAQQDGKYVGRIGAIKDDLYIQSKQRNIGYFGFFECIPNKDVALALQDAAIQSLKQQGLDEVMGPVSPSPNHIIGMLTDFFDAPPVVQTPYNPKYYTDFFTEELGWKKEMDFYAYRLDKGIHKPSEKAFRVAKLAREHNKKLSIRPIDLKNFDKDVEFIRQIWNEAWLDHREFVPWPEEEFQFMAKGLRMVANPKLAKLAFIEGEPAGFVVPIPNINEALIKSSGHLSPLLIARLLKVRKGGDWLRLAILGVREKFQQGGIEAIMLTEAYETGVELGYQHADMSFIIEDNEKLLKLLDHMKFDRYRTYRVYQKKI